MKVKPTNGKWRAVNAALAVGGAASEDLITVSSTSKFDVSVGLLTSGIYGAELSRRVIQSIPSNHGWFYITKN